MPVEYLSKTEPQAGCVYYVDCSALFALATVEAANRGGAVDRRALENATTKTKHLEAFLKKAPARGAPVRTSVLALEELAALVRNNARSEALKVAGGRYRRWGEFKRQEPGAATSADVAPHKAMMLMVSYALSRATANGIEFFRGASRSGSAPSDDSDLVKAFVALLAKHQELDAMDALHVVIGTDLGAKHFISFDIGWEAVSTITVLR